MTDRPRGAISRRSFLRAGLYGGAATLLPWDRVRAQVLEEPALGGASFIADFASAGWTPFAVEGIANTEVDGASGVLIATSDVYPSDARALAFLRDTRLRDAKIEAQISATGTESGLVLRRVGYRRYYAALYQKESGLLSILRKTPDEETVLASISAPSGMDEALLEFWARPDPVTAGLLTELSARLTPAAGAPVPLIAVDGTPELQQAGDPGILSTANGNIPPELQTAPPGVGDFRAFYGTAQGEQFLQSPAGQQLKQLHRVLGTGVFESVEVHPIADALGATETPGLTLPSSVAATTLPLDEDLLFQPPLHLWLGARDPGAGVRLGVVTDVPAQVRIEYALSSQELDPAQAEALLDTPGATSLSDPVTTNAFTTGFVDLIHLARNEWLYWRPRLQRRLDPSGPTVGPEVVDPYQAIQGVRTLPNAEEGEACFVIASCATQFGAPDGPPGTLALIEQEKPHAFVWEGDLHYPDSQGLNSQNEQGYEGIWKSYLQTPELRAIIDRTIFSPQRDDHDYGGNDVARAKILAQLQHGVEPYERIVGTRYGDTAGGEQRIWYRFASPGMVEFLVLEQRRWKDTPEDIADVPFDPGNPAPPAKTLIGEEQREWLLGRLADPEPTFKVVCSGTPLNFPVNNENHWGTPGPNGFMGERDYILHRLDEISANENPGVRDRTIWVTGDSHSGMVVQRPHFLELRPTPLNIAGEGGAPLALPDPSELPATNDEILYSQNGNFFVLIKTRLDPGATPEDDEIVMEVQMMHESGTPAWPTGGPVELRAQATHHQLLPEPSGAVLTGVGGAALGALYRLRKRRDGDGDS